MDRMAAILRHLTSVVSFICALKPESHDLWDKKFHYLRVSTGDRPLIKKPEDSGYEIGVKAISFSESSGLLVSGRSPEETLGDTLG